MTLALVGSSLDLSFDFSAPAADGPVPTRLEAPLLAYLPLVSETTELCAEVPVFFSTFRSLALLLSDLAAPCPTVDYLP